MSSEADELKLLITGGDGVGWMELKKAMQICFQISLASVTVLKIWSADHKTSLVKES